MNRLYLPFCSVLLVGCALEKERWVHYEGYEDPKALGEYGSYEECSVNMRAYRRASGCRRVDGPYGLLNKIADMRL